MRRSFRFEDGAAAVELAVTIPIMLLILAVMVGAGRLWSTKASVIAIAREAGRAAVEEPDPAAAAAAARQTAHDRAQTYGLDPSRLVVEAAGALERGGVYTVNVRYDVRLRDVPGLGLLPSSVEVAARHAEPVDLYGGR